MRVLVAYGSKMGGTKGIAETVGEELRTAGLEADVCSAGERVDVNAYDAIVVGGALYAMRWHKDARRFVKRNAAVMRTKPVWFFSDGPLDDSASQSEIPPVKGVQKLMDRVNARGHVTFGGRLPTDAHGFPASAMAKEHAGDWRDPDKIRSWADQVAAALTAQ